MSGCFFLKHGVVAVHDSSDRQTRPLIIIFIHQIVVNINKEIQQKILTRQHNSSVHAQ